MNKINLVNKYVYINFESFVGDYKKDFNHYKNLYLVYDKDNDPAAVYPWCLKNIQISKFEIWVKSSEIIVLPDNEQLIVKLLYE